MIDGGWVRLGDCEPGTLVEPVAFGTQWLFTGFVRPDDGTGETHELYGVGADEMIYLPADALVYPLTAVRLHPSLRGSDLPGLCAAALADPNEGTMGRLLDWLGDELGRDPDVAAAVRERCAGECEADARQSARFAEGESLTAAQGLYGEAAAGRRLADRIRALGRPAAAAAGSESRR